LRQKEFLNRLKHVVGLQNSMENDSIDKKRWEQYKNFHKNYTAVGDCDPAYPTLKYVADQLNYNMEERCLLAWVYSSCYNDVTAFYIFKNLYRTTNIDTWWKEYKPKLIFTTDRLKVKSFNKFPKMYKSYKQLVGDEQWATLSSYIIPNDPITSYNNLYKFADQFFYFGRFSLFLYLELLNYLTDIPISIDNLELEKAESCRNGLCYAIGKDKWISKTKFPLTKEHYKTLYYYLHKVVEELQKELPHQKTTYWNVETSLCAYKKLFWESRYLGYYLDRSLANLHKQKEMLPELNLTIFWEARKKLFHKSFLGELNNWKEIRKDRYKIFNKYNSFYYPNEFLYPNEL